MSFSRVLSRLSLLGLLLALGACGSSSKSGSKNPSDPDPENFYQVGGVVVGMVAGELHLTDGVDNVRITADGNYILPRRYRRLDTYAVRVSQQPDNQLCNVISGRATGVVLQNVSDVDVVCTTISDIAVHFEKPARHSFGDLAVSSLFDDIGTLSGPSVNLRGIENSFVFLREKIEHDPALIYLAYVGEGENAVVIDEFSTALGLLLLDPIVVRSMHERSVSAVGFFELMRTQSSAVDQLANAISAAANAGPGFWRLQAPGNAVAEAYRHAHRQALDILASHSILPFQHIETVVASPAHRGSGLVFDVTSKSGGRILATLENSYSRYVDVGVDSVGIDNFVGTVSGHGTVWQEFDQGYLANRLIRFTAVGPGTQGNVAADTQRLRETSWQTFYERLNLSTLPAWLGYRSWDTSSLRYCLGQGDVSFFESVKNQLIANEFDDELALRHYDSAALWAELISMELLSDSLNSDEGLADVILMCPGTGLGVYLSGVNSARVQAKSYLGVMARLQKPFLQEILTERDLFEPVNGNDVIGLANTLAHSASFVEWSYSTRLAVTISLDRNEADVGETVALSASCTDPVTGLHKDCELTWTLGDGVVSAGSSVNHVYGNAGTYTIQVEAGSSDGGTAIAQASVQVRPKLPRARLMLPLGASVGSGSTLDFGEVATGGSTELTLVLKNVGNSPLVVTDARVAGIGFSLTATGDYQVGTGEDSLTLVIKFAPGLIGDFNGVLLIATDDPESPQLLVNLRGQAFDSVVAGNYGSWHFTSEISKTVTSVEESGSSVDEGWTQVTAYVDDGEGEDARLALTLYDFQGVGTYGLDDKVNELSGAVDKSCLGAVYLRVPGEDAPELYCTSTSGVNSSTGEVQVSEGSAAGTYLFRFRFSVLPFFSCSGVCEPKMVEGQFLVDKSAFTARH